MRLYALQPPRLQMYPPSLHDALPIWEAAAAYAYNRLHIVKDLGHEGPWYFHLKFLTYSYHPVLVALLVMGIALVWIRYRPQRRMTIAMLAMVAVTYGFFAYVATKMPDRKSTRLNSSHVKISYAV